MYSRRGHERHVDDIDSLSDAPSGNNRAHGLVYGIFCAGLIAALGVRIIVTRYGWLPFGDGQRNALRPKQILELHGSDAVSLGCVLLTFAGALHFHSFWGNHPKLVRYYEPLKVLSLVLLLITCSVFAYRLLRTVWQI